MTFRSLLLAPLISAVWWPLTAFADGMPIEGGRFVGGPTTILTLSSSQAGKLMAAENCESRKELVLSQAQRLALQESAGAAPLTLLIYNTRKSENDCCCDARNRALWFSDSQIEVPHEYLVAEGVPPIVHGNGWPLGIAGIATLVVLTAGVVIASRVVPRGRR
jgi:hypothetical protein